MSKKITSIHSLSATAGFMAAIGFISASHGATTIDFTLKQKGLADTIQVSYIDNGKALIKAAGGDPNIDLLFQKSTETMTIINHEDRSTMDFNAEKVSAMARQASGMMDLVRQQLTAQMENMSEQQREQLQKMIEGMGGGQLVQPPPPPPRKKSLKATGVQNINGFACNKTEIFEDGQKVAEVCTTPADVLGIPAADFAVIEAMRNMSDKLGEEIGKISGQMGQNLPQFGGSEIAGVPVQIKDKSGMSMTITQIRPGIGDIVLDIPAGYSTKQMPGLPQLAQ